MAKKSKRKSKKSQRPRKRQKKNKKSAKKKYKKKNRTVRRRTRKTIKKIKTNNTQSGEKIYKVKSEWLKKALVSKNIYDKKSFYGKKGTCFLANTRAFHRGVKVSKNYRLILELYFSSSIFGKHEFYNPYTRPKLDNDWPSYEIWDKNIKRNKFLYESLFVGKI